MDPHAATLVVTLVLTLTPVLAGAQQDVRGSADHPLFPTRMPGYYISNYQQSEFDSYKFRVGKDTVTVEGKVTRINYRRPREVAHPGALAIRRNYENAIKERGGQLVGEAGSASVFKAATPDGSEVWVEVYASNTPSAPIYRLVIVEKTAMKQTITAGDLRKSLDADGSVSVSIEFESGSAAIRPESMAIVEEIATMLRADPKLALVVEGHTDNVGTAESNRTLSQQRAGAVVAALEQRGIARGRLDAAGFGEDKPLADNSTEEGRARNRRVTLVKK
jgi:outer membrane protein OmpA-like peptidoglycan-associated protein